MTDPVSGSSFALGLTARIIKKQNSFRKVKMLKCLTDLVSQKNKVCVDKICLLAEC